MATEPLVLLPVDELKAIVAEAVREALRELSSAEPARYLDTREAADFLGVHRDTLARMVRKGLVPASRIGREYRFRREDLAALDVGIR